MNEARKQSLLNNDFKLQGLNGNGMDTKIDMREETYTASQEDLKRQLASDSILKRIPEGAEATTVLVSFLHQMFY